MHTNFYQLTYGKYKKCGYFKLTRKVKVLSLPETIKGKIDVPSEGPLSGVSMDINAV